MGAHMQRSYITGLGDLAHVNFLAIYAGNIHAEIL